MTKFWNFVVHFRSSETQHHEDVQVNVYNALPYSPPFADKANAILPNKTDAPICSVEKFIIQQEKRLIQEIKNELRNSSLVKNVTCQFLTIYEALFSSDKKLDSIGKFLECQEMGVTFGGCIGSVLKLLDIAIGQKLAQSQGVRCRVGYLIFGAVFLVSIEILIVKIHDKLKQRHAATNNGPIGTNTQHTVEAQAHIQNNTNPQQGGNVFDGVAPILFSQLKDQFELKFGEMLNAQTQMNPQTVANAAPLPNAMNAIAPTQSFAANVPSVLVSNPGSGSSDPTVVWGSFNGFDVSPKLSPKNSPLFSSQASRRRNNNLVV